MDYQPRLTVTSYRVTATKYPCMYVCMNKVNFFLPMPTSDHMDQNHGSKDLHAFLLPMNS